MATPTTKQEVMDYYANNRTDSNRGLCPEFVISHLGTMSHDDIGLYTMRGELLEQREYYTLDEVMQEIRCALADYIKDLTKLLAIPVFRPIESEV